MADIIWMLPVEVRGEAAVDTSTTVKIDAQVGQPTRCQVWVGGELRFIGTGVTGDVMADVETQIRALARTMVPPHVLDCPGRPGYRGMCTCGDRTKGDWVPLEGVLAVLHYATVAPDLDND